MPIRPLTFFVALQAISWKNRNPVDCMTQETHLIGVPRLALAQALAQMWKLPDDLVKVFGSTGEFPPGRWQSGFQTYRGIVVGSTRLVDITVDHGPRAALEEAKRTLLIGSGMASGLFADLMIRAMDRGRQLIRSMGLVLDSTDETIEPPTEHAIIKPISHQSPDKQTIGDAQTVSPKQTAPAQYTPEAPIQSNPLKTLQAFQGLVQEAKVSTAY